MPLKGAKFISYLFIQRNRGKRKNSKIWNRSGYDLMDFKIL